MTISVRPTFTQTPPALGLGGGGLRLGGGG